MPGRKRKQYQYPLTKTTNCESAKIFRNFVGRNGKFFEREVFL